MVVKVKLKGLNIVQGRIPGTWYVYPRGGGGALIKGFEGSRDELLKKLAEPGVMQACNRPRLQKNLAGNFSIETLGGFIHWYTNGDIDRLVKEALADPSKVTSSYPKWSKLSKATRQDYLEAFDYLRPEFDIPLADITQPALYDVRDTCAAKKWPRFADQMTAALSSMFKQAVKRGKMPFNPCLGMEKAHTADPTANRDWFGHEWSFVIANAPVEVLIPCMMARYAGLAEQTFVAPTV